MKPLSTSSLSAWAPVGSVQAYYPLSDERRVQAEDLRRFLSGRREELGSQQAAPKRFRILVVDDEELVRDYVADMLQASGFDCVVEVISVKQLKHGHGVSLGATPAASLTRPTPPVKVGTGRVLWDFLKSVRGWDCVNVSASHAADLGRVIEADLGSPVGYYDDLYHILTRPVARYENRRVRLFTSKDLWLLESAPPDLRESGFGEARTLLSEGIAAGAVVRGRIVSISHTYAPAGQHADLGVYTLAGWRCKGFATAAAAIVAGRVQEMGLTPVWRADRENLASLRVAKKLGFIEIARRTYVVPSKAS